MKPIIAGILLTFLLVPLRGDAGVLSNEQMKETPRIRIASSPYPNPLFRALKTPRLGEHHYRAQLLRFKREVSRGHLYTERGGFIDIAHLRKTVDWAAYLQKTFANELQAGRTTIIYRCSEPSQYTLQVSIPERVNGWTAEEQRTFQHALSIHLALYASYTALTWHEILTWYGFSAVPGLSEQESAFSYEDMFSHAVGIAVARKALMDKEHAYNTAVTLALDTEIERLRPMKAAEMRQALSAIEGTWWRYGKTLKRYINIGTDGLLHPWLAPVFPCENPARYAAPNLQDVNGINMTDYVDLSIEPRVQTGKKILRIVDDSKTTITPTIDFPLIMVHIQRAMEQRFGDNVNLPHTHKSHLVAAPIP